MGQSSAETVREIEETRGRLESDIRELEERLPAPAMWVKKVAGIAVGGGITGAAFWFGVRRLRKRTAKKKASEQATQAVINVIPDEWAKRLSSAMESGEWKGWMVIGGSIWLLLRLAELRQIRKTNRMLVMSARPAPPIIA
jgi:hypothetical protein